MMDQCGSEAAHAVRVLCRSDGAAEQTVRALVIDAQPREVVAVEDDRYSGAVRSGGGVVREVRVRLMNGSRYHLQRRLPDGEWTVRRMAD